MKWSWFFADDVVTEECKKSPAPAPKSSPLEERILLLEREMKRVIKPRERTGTDLFDFYALSWGPVTTLESRIQALEDAKKPRCPKCKKIK